MLDLANDNAPVKTDTVTERLTQLGRIEEVGGGVYLSKLLDMPAAVDPKHYAKIIQGYALKRRLIEIGNAILKSGHRQDVDPDEALNKAQSLILNIGSNTNGDGTTSFKEELLNAGDRYEALQRTCVNPSPC